MCVTSAAELSKSKNGTIMPSIWWVTRFRFSAVIKTVRTKLEGNQSAFPDRLPSPRLRPGPFSSGLEILSIRKMAKICSNTRNRCSIMMFSMPLCWVAAIRGRLHPCRGTGTTTMEGRMPWSKFETGYLKQIVNLVRPHKIDKGETDEGDPWFVFLDKNEEVTAHIARLNGGYVIFQPHTDYSVRGDCFPDVLKQFFAL